METRKSKFERCMVDERLLSILESRYSNFDFRVSLFRSILTPDFFTHEEARWKELIVEIS